MKKTELIKKIENIPTYVPKPANTLPMFFEKKPSQGASGKLYPIPYSDGISDEKTDVDYEVYTIENGALVLRERIAFACPEEDRL